MLLLVMSLHTVAPYDCLAPLYTTTNRSVSARCRKRQGCPCFGNGHGTMTWHHTPWEASADNHFGRAPFCAVLMKEEGRSHVLVTGMVPSYLSLSLSLSLMSDLR